MTTKSIKLRMEKSYDGYCRTKGCAFSMHGAKSNSAARTHVKNTGHEVEVYWEIGRVIKRI